MLTPITVVTLAFLVAIAQVALIVTMRSQQKHTQRMADQLMAAAMATDPTTRSLVARNLISRVFEPAPSKPEVRVPSPDRGLTFEETNG